MYEKIQNVLSLIDNMVWGIPLIALLLFTGIFFTFRLRGIQFTQLKNAIKFLNKKDADGEEGDVSGFGALCTALSATIGTGNIVGVATAIVAGGPGALFWMWIAALFGTATKFSECMLAHKFREVSADGHILGGPFYYIEKGMGEKWKWMAKLFAIFGIFVGVLGTGTFTQINGISSAINDFFDPKNLWSVELFGRSYSWTVIITGIVVTIVVGLVLIGGIKRISKVAEVIVPFMAILYVVSAFAVIICNITKVPMAVVEIIKGAFGIRQVAGGAIGTMFVAMQKGVSRGIFSNEAGLGSAPIAAAAAKTNETVVQGLISMLGTYIDTIVVCSLTGIIIVITGAWDMGFDGVVVTMKAYEIGFPIPGQVSDFILMVCLIFFAFTTILGWEYYSEKCLEYLIHDNMKIVNGYKWLYIIAIFIGPYMTVSAVWKIADICNGLMAIPNIVALLALSGVVVAEVKKYSLKK